MLSVFKVKSIKKNLCGSSVEDIELKIEYSAKEINEINKEVVETFVELYNKFGGKA